MNARFLLWISAPVALSVGVLWLSAQEPKGEPKAALAEGVKVAELASQLQNRERAIAQKEAELRQLEQRLTTLQATLDKDRGDLAAREKALQEALARPASAWRCTSTPSTSPPGASPRRPPWPSWRA